MSDMDFINYRHFVAAGSWMRADFIRNWWRLAAYDRRWLPPHYLTLRRALNPAQTPHLARLDPLLLHLEALPTRRHLRSRTPLPGDWTVVDSVMEVPMAAAIITRDARRRDRAAYLVWPQMRNHEETVDYFFDALRDELLLEGVDQLIGPVGLSPHLDNGLLQDNWDVLPPLHTPYYPPYMPDLLGERGTVMETSRLYQVPVSDVLPPVSGVAELRPFPPSQLADTYLHLLQAACESSIIAVPPDAAEAAFILRWLLPGSLKGWLAQIAGEPVGFVLLQPDLSPWLRRTQGGWHWWSRLWGLVPLRSRVEQGRIIFGGVLPAWRRQGIGRQLMAQAMHSAAAQGWSSLAVGPLPETATAVTLLHTFNATPRQTYTLHQWRL